LSAGKLTRCRAYDVACAFVTHFEQVYIIKVGRKLKAERATLTAPDQFMSASTGAS